MIVMLVSTASCRNDPSKTNTVAPGLSPEAARGALVEMLRDPGTAESMPGAGHGILDRLRADSYIETLKTATSEAEADGAVRIGHWKFDLNNHAFVGWFEDDWYTHEIMGSFVTGADGNWHSKITSVAAGQKAK